MRIGYLSIGFVTGDSAAFPVHHLNIYDFVYICFRPAAACVVPEKSVPGGGALAPGTRIVIECWSRLICACSITGMVSE